MNILDLILIWNTQICNLIQFLCKVINTSHTSTFKNWESKRSNWREDETFLVDAEGWISLACFCTFFQTTLLKQSLQQENNRWLKEITAHLTPCVPLPPVTANVFTTEVWETAKLGQALDHSCLQQYYLTWTLSFHLFFSVLCGLLPLFSWATPKIHCAFLCPSQIVLSEKTIVLKMGW